MSKPSSPHVLEPQRPPMERVNDAENSPKTIFYVVAIFVVLAIFYYPPFDSLVLWGGSTSTSFSPNDYGGDLMEDIRAAKKCDIFKGEWVPNPGAPYYTNETCPWIHDHLNCMKFGRPDTDFMKWRWKPNDCELPIFNPGQFLQLVRGKSMAFVGDSVGRNQMQSLMCLLSRVASPVDVSPTTDQNFKRWSYPTYKFTLANLWSTHLVTSEEADRHGDRLSGLYNLYLDEPDTSWMSLVRDFDYVVLSVGHWFFRPTMYYENRRLVGCYHCSHSNVTSLPLYYGYRQAFRTAFWVLNTMPGFKGMTLLRTYSPDHFEGGVWNEGADCVRKRPFSRNETRFDGFNFETYMTQVEEFQAAKKKGAEKGLEFRLMDTTEAMLMRPDGHPGRYGHPASAKVDLYNDCVHWCLPGPVDTWNDFMLHIMKMEGGRGLKGRRTML